MTAKSKSDPRAQIRALRTDISVLKLELRLQTEGLQMRVEQLASVIGTLDNRIAELRKDIGAIDALKGKLAEQSQINRFLKTKLEKEQERTVPIVKPSTFGVP